MQQKNLLTASAQIAILAGIGLALLVVGRDFLIPLVLAVMVWSLLDAMADLAQKIRIGGRPLPRWLAMILSILSMGSVLLIIYQVLASQAEALERAAPLYQENFNRMLNEVVAKMGLEALPTSETLLDSINIGSLLGWVGGSVGALVSTLILVLIYTGFLFAEQGVMPRKLRAMHRDAERAAHTEETLKQIAGQVQHYIWMKTLVSLATGILSYVILKLVGVDFAAVWALLIFMLNFIPNIGSILGVALPALLTLVQFDTLTPFLIITLGLGAVQFIIGNLLEPAVMGKSLNLSSLMIILSLTFWGMIWGIPGMFLSVPMMVMVAIICARFEGLRPVAVILSANGEIASPTEREEAAHGV